MASALTATRIEVGALIDGRPLAPIQLRIMLICGMVMLLDGYDIQVMALAVPSVSELWGAAPAKFSIALTAALAGMGLGAGLIAPWGDKIGRRPVMAMALTLAGVATLCTSLSHSLTDFVIWRAITGLGIGGSIANAMALTLEYMPARRRIWLSCVMYCNVSLGAFSAGFLAPWLLRLLDWRGLFLFGGGLTLAVAATVWFGVPESLKFLMAWRRSDPRIVSTLRRLAPDVDPDTVDVSPDQATKRRVLDLLSSAYRMRTLLLWSVYIFTSFIIYVLTSWLPTLLRQAGWPPDEALVGAVLFQLGSVGGTIVLTSFVDGGRLRSTLVVGYLLCASGLAGLLLIPSSFVTWTPLMLAIGGGVGASQCILVALGAAFYPLAIRAAGVGWAVMIGRVGSISAPLVGGVLIQHFSPVQTLGLLIIPAIICASGSLLMRRQWMAG